MVTKHLHGGADNGWDRRVTGDGKDFDWIATLISSGPPIPPDSASANLIGRIVGAAVAKGASRPLLLETIGVNERSLRNQLSRVSGQVMFRLFAAIETQLKDPALAIIIGQESKPSCFSDLGYATRLMPDLGSALEANIWMQVLRQNMYWVETLENGSDCRLGWNIGSHPANDVAAAVEFSVATYVRLSREICGDHLAYKQIAFQHLPRFEPRRYEQLLNAPVIFGAQRTEILYPDGAWKAPSPIANPALLAKAQACHRRPVEWINAGKPGTAHSFFYLWTELNKSPVTLDRVARSFGMSERTLRRQLVDEGNPFRTLLDDLRRDMCELYRAENKRSLSEVAELLGYGELSAFTRAHRRWYGEPPSYHWKHR